MKITLHSGRTNRHGQAFLAGHNDRSAGVGDHVGDSSSNVYGSCRLKVGGVWTTAEDRGQTFEEHEKMFYDRVFSKWLEAQNSRYLARGQKGRIRDMDRVYRSPRTCPDEVLYYLGNKKDHPDPEVLKGVMTEFRNWQRKRFPGVVVLDTALHLDEATPHYHMRFVWVSKDREGHWMPSQAGALRDMGIDPPDPSKPIDRYNNPKQTYTRECREKLVELAREAGLDIDDVPREPGKAGLDLKAFQARALDEEIALKYNELQRIGEYENFLRMRDEDLEI